MYMQTIFVVGDSTVENGSSPFYGWGGQLAAFLPGIRVENLAKGGRSSKSFLAEGLFEPARQQMRTGDLLLIQFGHNDEKDDPERHTDPQTTFPDTLKAYVSAARASGATPVLLTSVSRNYFLGYGSLLYTHGEYPLAVRTLCQREQIALIDLEKETRALLISLGPKDAGGLFVNVAPGADPQYPEGIEDRSHFCLHGARTVARMVAADLSALGLIRSHS